MEIQANKNPVLVRPYSILIVVAVIAICGIVYELLISTAASHLLGNSIMQFSIIIGIYMSSIGLGSYLSKFFEKNLLDRFIDVELLIALIGGYSILAIFWFFSYGGMFYTVVLYGLTVIIGALVGFEIPLVIRLMETNFKLKDNVANVLAIDYLGGLIGSVSFPLLFLPTLGVLKTALLVGILNIASVFWLLLKMPAYKKRKEYFILSLIIFIFLGGTLIKAEPVGHYLEQSLYKDKIEVSLQSPYQRLVVTKYKDDVRLFIDGNLQFSTVDEYRYHEGLVHIPAGMIPHLENVLILGGGDGLAARELLKYPSLNAITIVDLDKALTDLFTYDKTLTKINNGSLRNPKVTVINEDALTYVENSSQFYDLIIIDLPDPRSSSLAKLYNQQFYSLIKRRLSKTGIMVTQATSPFFSRDAFWCIYDTAKSVFNNADRYHINVQSFGEWGFVIGGHIAPLKERLDKIDTQIPTRYLTSEIAKSAFYFGKDMSPKNSIQVNTLFNPVIIDYYNKGWENW